MTDVSLSPECFGHKGLVTLAAPIAIAISCIALLVAPSEAAAQDQADKRQNAASDAQPGSIIVSRRVPYGTALERMSKGKPLRVKTAPQGILLPALTQGLKPLTDAQQGAVTGSTLKGMAEGNTLAADSYSYIGAALSTGVSQQRGSGDGGVGGIVSDALASLPSVGAIVRNAGTGK